MQHQVTPLFSAPIFKTDIGIMDSIEKTWIKSLQFTEQTVGTYSGEENIVATNKGMKVLEQPQLKKLREQIQKALDFFTDQILDIEERFEITTSWVNRYSKEDLNDKHSHPNSMISGVYYIESDDTSAPIIFEKPYLYTNLFHDSIKPTFKNKNNNQFNTDYYGFKPKSGELLLFPSWLEHSVPTQKIDQFRYSLAFNCFMRGNMGTGTEQLQL